MIGAYDKKNIIKKLQELPTELLGEVEDFIDFLKAKNEKKKANLDLYQSEESINLIKEPKSIYGAAKGTILYISDDFNKPLDEMKDYM